MKIKKRGIQIPVRIIINALIILFEIALLVVSAVKFSEKFLRKKRIFLFCVVY